MFQNVLMTAMATPLSSTNEIDGWENRPFTTVWPEKQHKSHKGAEITKTIKKKAKRVRTAFTTDQIRNLEKVFSRTKYIDSERRRLLASQLNIGEKSIKIWFQNRRMKEKRDSESSCDSSSESFSNAASPPIDVQPNVMVESSGVNVESLNCTYSTQYNNNCSVNSSEDRAESLNHMYSAQYFNAEHQYQVPYVQYNNYPHYNNTAYAMPSNTSFCYDTNVYPTEYFPNTEYYADQYQLNNWSNDVTEMHY